MDYLAISILVITLSLGFVFTAEFLKSVHRSLLNKEIFYLFIQLLSVLFSVSCGYLISESDYISKGKMIWFIDLSLLILGLIQYLYYNWNISLKKELLKATSQLIEKKSGVKVKLK